MPKRMPEPWYWTARQSYYVTLDGQQIPLGHDREEVYRRYHEIMARRRPGVVVRNVSGTTVYEVFDRFLTWVRANRSEATYDDYLRRLQHFSDYIGGKTLLATDLRPHHVTTWADSHDWNATTKRGRMMAVQTAMTWAADQGVIDVRPLIGLKKPAAERRENNITPEQFETALSSTTNTNLLDVLRVTWDTGCRPQEVTRVEACHVDLAGGRWVFPERESKGKRRQRVVYLTPSAVAICTRLVAKWRKGPIFRNEDGNPWTCFAIDCGLKKIAEKTGCKFALYDVRHSFATQRLLAGVDPITVAAIMGHQDATTLARVYSHVHRDHSHLQDALAKQRPT